MTIEIQEKTVFECSPKLQIIFHKCMSSCIHCGLFYCLQYPVARISDLGGLYYDIRG